MSAFADRYGPWALVAGASEGLGESFARLLAGRGLNLLLVARRAGPLEALAARLRAKHGVEVRTAALDLAAPDLAGRAAALVDGLDLGLLVYNAAASAIGPFLDAPLEAHLRVVEVNCRGPVVLCYLLGARLAARGRGGILLMASLAGGQGTAYVASYAASKAFDLVLAEGLWVELAERGVDVLACRAGPVRTPAYLASKPKRSVPIMEPDAVAERALRRLGHGPVTIPGALNRITAFLFGRVLTRRASVRLMGRATRGLYG